MSTADYLSSNPCTHNYADIQQKHRFNARYAAQYVIKFSQLPRDNINSNHHDCSRFFKCTENEICCWGQPLQRRQYQLELTFLCLEPFSLQQTYVIIGHHGFLISSDFVHLWKMLLNIAHRTALEHLERCLSCIFRIDDHFFF